MKRIIVVLSLGILAVAGCGDQSKTASDKAKESSGNPLTAPADYVGAVVKAQQTAVKTVDIASITKAIQMFSVEQGRYPKTLDELVAEQYLPRIPEVPQGMRFQYHSNTGTIKIVPR